MSSDVRQLTDRLLLCGNFLAHKTRSRIQSSPVRYQSRWTIYRVYIWEKGMPIPDRSTSVTTDDGDRITFGIQGEEGVRDTKPQAISFLLNLVSRRELLQ